MATRTCIVTRQTGIADDDLIRFVAAPDGEVVPDLRHRLPGRGVWVTARKPFVEKAVAGRLFSRGLKQDAKASDGLAEQVDMLLTQAALGSLGFAKKAGACITGADKVERLIRNGKAIGVLHALDGAEDGLRKIVQALRAVGDTDGGQIHVWRVFTSQQMDLALGAARVIHAALTEDSAARNCLDRVVQLARYRDMEP